MYIIITIVFAITFSLYLYVKSKVKGHDFQAANNFRPILHALLFISIELFIPIFSFIVIKIIYAITNSESVLSGVGITIALMAMVPFYFPFLSWREKPQYSRSYALYLRSFRSDKGLLKKPMRSIMSLIRCFYPTYAIGNPNETVSLFKRAISIYKTDTDWKNAVSEYKENAKIIILKLDGTDGLLWEVKSIIEHLSKVLFIAEEKETYEQFVIKTRQNEIAIFDSFPSLSNFPSIIWNQNGTWLSINDIDYIAEYFYAHPWQEESVDTILDNIVLNSRTGEYYVNRYKSFFRGAKDIRFHVKFQDRLLFLLFPYNQQFYTIWNMSNAGSASVTLYLVYCAIFYYLIWFILPYCFFDPDGISLSNSRFIGLIHFFLPSIPVFLFSLVNGPKSFWLSHSYMNPHSLRISFLKNAIIGCITISLSFGLGWYSKSQSIKQVKERKELMSRLGINEVEIKKRMETRQLKEHIDSICNDVMASAVLTGYIFAEEFQSNDMVVISYKYQQAIRDSLGLKEYYPSTRDSLMPDKWYSSVAWSVVKNLYHQNNN